jgi:serine/threonine protein kinase/WD40 repeat protein
MEEQVIFTEALGKVDPVERASYLEQLCSGSPDLRERVERLLARHENAGNFLESPRPGLNGIFADTPIAVHAGTVIGPYKLLQQIGEGGMGVVFMAEQTVPVRRKVALKIIKPGMDTKQVIARFEAERQALALMDHPNIARVFDAGTTESGRPYFVMELVHGVPITEFCDKNGVGTRERLELFVTVCQAVQHAHQKSVIHRDIKPANIMVTLHDGTPLPKVIDFGIAKAVGQELTPKTIFTAYGQMIGTPQYMSPEQAEMSGLDVDTRSDVYSLGVLLYELLTGKTPLEAQRFGSASYAEIQRIICEEEPTKPSTRLSTLGDELTIIAEHRRTDPKHLCQLVCGDLDWIAMKSLEKDRRRRYQTANALAMDIQRNLRDEPVIACPPSVAYRLRKFARRHKSAFAAGVVVALALLLGTIVSTWQAVRATVSERLAQQRFESEKLLRRQADDAKLDAKRRLLQAKLSEARAERRSGVAGQRVSSWNAIVEAALLARELGAERDVLLELRNEAIACLALVDVQQVKDVVDIPTGSSGLAFDDDLTLYARGDSEGKVFVHRVADGKALGELPASSAGTQGGAAAAGMSFAPDGNLLAVLNLPANHFRLWDWQRDKVAIEPPFAIDGRATAFSPDGSRLALGQIDGTLSVYNAITGNEELKVSMGMRPAHLSYSPTGDRLAIAGRSRDQVQVRDAVRGEVLQTISIAGGGLYVAWHPAGIILAVGCQDRSIHLYNSMTGSRHATLAGHTAAAQGLWFADGGNMVISTASDWSTKFWDSWTGRELVRIAPMALHVSRDGSRLVTESAGTLSLWQVEPAHEYQSLPKKHIPFDEGLHHGDISPDGRWLAIGTTGGIRMWDLALRTEVPLPPMLSTQRVEFDASGRELITTSAAGIYRWPMLKVGGIVRIGPFTKLPVATSQRMTNGDDRGRTRILMNQQESGQRTVELTSSLSAVELMDPESGSVWCRLDAPDTRPISWVGISPDSNHLVVCRSQADVQIWNLFKIRSRLRQIGLDWDDPLDWPSLASVEAETLQVELDFGAFDLGLLPGPYRRRASELAAIGSWTEAAELQAKALELDPTDHFAWHNDSVLRLKTGDVEGYRRVCREMLERFGGTDDPNIAERTAKTCCIGPDAVSDYRPVVQLAERALNLLDVHGHRRAFLLARGMADYRCGNYEGAVDWLHQSFATGKQTPLLDALANLFLAMAHHRLGEFKDAQVAFAQAKALAEKSPSLDSDHYIWADWQRFHIVRHEAEELLHQISGQ